MWIWTHHEPACSSVSGSPITAQPSLSPVLEPVNVRSAAPWSAMGS